MAYKQNRYKELYLKDLAYQRAKILLDLAKKVVKEDLKLSQDYVSLARKILSKARVTMRGEWNYRFCRKCNTILIPGVTARIRIRARRTSHIVLTCLICKNKRRFILKKRQK